MATGFTYRHYILKDHLGSWTSITDAEGNVEQELSFDAWGTLRDPETWTGTSTEAPMFDRGYTGHEHITAFGLINMNGRCYDPLMSSFLSVDEYVQDPSNAQNFNRYAYCLNNPLKYTDPSGWMYLGASHSQECEFNRYRRYVNAHLTEEQWANSGINRTILAYVKMGVGYIMTPFMMGEEQKGGGGGIVIKGNDGINTAYSPGMEYKGKDVYTGKVVNALNTLMGTADGKMIIEHLCASKNTFFIESSGKGDFVPNCIPAAYAEYYKYSDPEIYQSFLEHGIDMTAGSGGTIYWSSYKGEVYTTDGPRTSPTTNLGHELAHAMDADMGFLVDEECNRTELYEWRAVYHENNMRQALGLPLRIGYGDDSEAEYHVRTIMLEKNNNSWSVMFPPKLPWIP